MANQFRIRKVFLSMTTIGVIGLSPNVFAAAYQLWEQDAASIGNYHAGTAASATDASTAWYNPAGLVRIQNQQAILGGDPIMTDFRFRGDVNVDTLMDPNQPVTAQGGGFNFVPFLHYAAPITDRFVFGFSVVVPFGLKTDYGVDPITRYAATLTSLKVVDVTPALGVAITDKFSVGAGVDWERAQADFNQTATAIDQTMDTLSNNTGSSTAWGYRLGALYQFTPKTRLGLDYNSKITHHLKGKSVFSGPLANNGDGGEQLSDNLRANTTLPAKTSLSLFHAFNCWDVMGSVSYIQWNVFKDLILQNVAGIQGMNATNNLLIIVHQNFHNTWNYAVGANYHPNEKWILRTGLGYDESPTDDRYRNLQLPDSDRIAAAIGAHYQATKTIGFDAGWTHIFAMNTRINNISQTVGDETVTTNGSVKASADAYGLQVVWDIV